MRDLCVNSSYTEKKRKLETKDAYTLKAVNAPTFEDTQRTSIGVLVCICWRLQAEMKQNAKSKWNQSSHVSLISLPKALFEHPRCDPCPGSHYRLL